MNITRFLCWAMITVSVPLAAQSGNASSRFVVARLKYAGGGDWYNDPSIIPNLQRFLRENTIVNAADDEARVSLMDDNLFSYPLLFMTGHGRITFSDKETERLRTYLLGGGFLLADDDYGMDAFFRREMIKVFPDKKMVELPFSHDLFHCHFEFPGGLPKIHEHDGGAPQGYAYFHQGRMITFYAFNTNISDGWADPDVHGDPQETRDKAFQIGANIIIYALTR